ncbi:hypothetical protein BJ170DRAFT_725884 [Xylariales sp. AK1849]|nr:hypothetical protein BJ170DRAFT_725884 [Xylariales sp. AK1849]
MAPLTFKEHLQRSNYKFERYRRYGHDINWFAGTTLAVQAAYTRLPVPSTDQLRLFWSTGAWKASPFARQGSVGDTQQTLTRYDEVTQWFGSPPRWNPQKALGVGGLGMAIHYKYKPNGTTDAQSRDFVLKVPIDQDDWQDVNARNEEKNTKRVQGSAHCIQTIEPWQVKGPPKEKFIRGLPDLLPSDDSSVDGSENEKKPRSRPKRRSTWTAAYKEHKRQKRARRDREIREEIDEAGDRPPPKDYILLEYLENGSLASLLYKLRSAEKGEGAIPQRVLWSFWLCMIRACVGLEYPVKKFHPLRERPESMPINAVDEAAARENKMFRTLKSLGIPIFDKAAHEEKNRQYEQLQGDMIEEVPTGALRQQGENIVHFDIDPSNIFVNGFELNVATMKEWKEVLDKDEGTSGPGTSTTQNAEKDTSGGNPKPFSHTAVKPDRAAHEHELVPRLKLADFGMAERIKYQKRNIYYLNRRWKAKQGMFAPEQFGAEWDFIPDERDGSQLADNAVAGRYSSATNVWGMALTMWSLITQVWAPHPPQAQVPPHLAGDVVKPAEGSADIDGELESWGYDTSTQPISYCEFLKDPEVDGFNWVDEDLRETVFRCMYHDPYDRPFLHELLDQAKQKLAEDFGESDEYIRRWIKKWFYEAPVQIPSSSSSGPLPPPSQGPKPGAGKGQFDQANYAAAQEDPNNPIRQQLKIKLNSDFPYGYDRIHNAATGLRCGIHAINDSLLAQQPAIADENSVPPILDQLQTIMDSLRANGEFDDFMVDGDQEEDGNYQVSQLARVLMDWGRLHSEHLQLAYVLEGRENPMWETVENPDSARIIWIHNDNAMDLTGGATRYNHFEGMRAKPRPVQEEDDSLPSYESDSYDGTWA